MFRPYIRILLVFKLVCAIGQLIIQLQEIPDSTQYGIFTLKVLRPQHMNHMNWAIISNWCDLSITLLFKLDSSYKQRFIFGQFLFWISQPKGEQPFQIAPYCHKSHKLNLSPIFCIQGALLNILTQSLRLFLRVFFNTVLSR